jgi:hypothetical protein
MQTRIVKGEDTCIRDRDPTQCNYLMLEITREKVYYENAPICVNSRNEVGMLLYENLGKCFLFDRSGMISFS